MLAAAVWLTLREMKQEEKNSSLGEDASLLPPRLFCRTAAQFFLRNC